MVPLAKVSPLSTPPILSGITTFKSSSKTAVAPNSFKVLSTHLLPITLLGSVPSTIASLYNIFPTGSALILVSLKLLNFSEIFKLLKLLATNIVLPG